MGRVARIAGAVVAGAIVLAWLVAPLAMRLALKRGMRDLRRNEGLVGTFDSVSHAGLGFELEGLDVKTPEGEPVASVKSIRATPKLAWPPVALTVGGARITQRGLDAWARDFAGANASWYHKTALTIRRDQPALAGREVRVQLDGLAIERPKGTIATENGVLMLRIPSSTRLELAFDGGLVMTTTSCGAPAHSFAALSSVVDVAQDSLTLHTEGDLASLSPVCRDCVVGHVEDSIRAAAPGWAGVTTTTSQAWSGPRELGCLLGR